MRDSTPEKHSRAVLDANHARIARARWRGTRHLRVLTYDVSVRWNWESAGAYIDHVLGSFVLPDAPPPDPDAVLPEGPDRYFLLAEGKGASRRYRLFFDDMEMMASADQRDALQYFSWLINTESMRRAEGFLVVHAGSVVSPDGDGVLLPGRSGAGKTSLVAGLVRAGFGYLSDEAAVIDPVTTKVYPYPKALTLKPGMFEYFSGLRNGGREPVTLTSQWHVRAEDLRDGCMAAPTLPSVVVLTRYEKGAQTSLTPMRRAEALIETSYNVMNARHFRARMLPLLGRVIQGSRCYRLVSGSLDEAVATVQAICEERPAVASVWGNA